MDKENEIEVIDTLNKFASLTFLYGGRICFFDEQLKKYQKAVKDMLNLYKEEKQAVRTKIIGKLDSVSLDDLIGDEYIRKDKIIEILNIHKETPIEYGWMFYDDIKNLLKEG